MSRWSGVFSLLFGAWQRPAPQPIPRLVHLFWTPPQGHCVTLPDEIEHHISEWRRLHPAYGVHVWSLDEVKVLADQIKTFPVWESVHACRFEAMQSDIARLAILYQLGGFYSDLKNLPMRPFLDELVDCKCALVPEHQPTIEHYQDRPSNSFLAAPPHHDFIRLYLRLACKNVSKRAAGSVIDVTGNSVLQRAMQKIPAPLAEGFALRAIHRGVGSKRRNRRLDAPDVGFLQQARPDSALVGQAET